MSLIQNQEMIQTFLSTRPHPPLRKCIRIWSLVGNEDDIDTFTPEEGVKGLGIFPIIVANQETCRSFLFIESPDQLSGLLSHPEPIWICSDASQVDTTRGQFDEKEHIQGLQPDRFYGKKVTSQDLFFIVCHQAAPTDGSAANWRRYDAVAFEHIADRGSGSFIT